MASAVVGALRVLLSADTAQFESKLKGADANVQKLANTMKRDLEPSQARINSLVRSFLGSKEIGMAENYAKAVQQIGGAAKLTAGDQGRVNKVVQEALAHYKALGKEAPKHLHDLAAATKQVQAPTEKMSSGFDGLLGKAKSLAGVFGVTLGAGALVSLAKGAFDAADRIGDLALKMGVSTDAAQRFQFAARQSGADVEDVTKAIVNMNTAVGGGDKSLVKGLEILGLKFEDIRAMKSEDMFRTIADAAGKMSDPISQATAVGLIFGEKVGAQMLPMIRENSLAAADGIHVMSEGTIRDLKEAKQAWENLFDSITILSGEVIVGLKNEWNTFFVDWKAGLKLLARVGLGMNVTAAQTLGFAEAGAATGTPDDIFLPLAKNKNFKSKDQRDAEEAAQKRAIANAERLEEAYQAWKRSMTGLSDESKKLLGWINRLAKEGYPSLLGSLIPLNRNTNEFIQHQFHLGQGFRALAGDAKLAADKIVLVARAADMSKVVNALPVQFGPGVSGGQIAAGAQWITQTADLKKLNAQLTIAATLIRAVGQVAQASFGTTARSIVNTTDMVVEYVIAMNAAKLANDKAAMSSAKLNLALGGTMMLYSAIANGLAEEKAEDEAWAQRLKSANERLIELGFTARDVADILASFGDGARRGGLLRVLDVAESMSARVTKALSKMSGALENFGGKAPQALQPLIASLLAGTRLTEQQRSLLEGLAGSPGWRDIEARAQALGVDLQALGSSFNAARIRDIAFGYVRDLTMFSEAGADADGVLRGMADELSALAVDAARTGSALPETLRPFIDRLREMGLLVDANGNAIGDLTFADMEDATLKGVTDVLKEIRDLLANMIPAAAGAAARGINTAFSNIRLPIFEPSSGGSETVGQGLGNSWRVGGGVPRQSIALPQLSGGTHGAYPDWGPGTPVMLHGREAVVPAGEGGGTMTLILERDGRAEARWLVPFIPGEVERLRQATR